MANLWVDPSFDLGYHGLTLYDFASVTSDYGAHSGTKALRLWAVRSEFGPIDSRSAAERTMAVLDEQTLQLSAWVWLDDRGSADLTVMCDVGGGFWNHTWSAYIHGSGWVLWTMPTISTISAGNLTIRFDCRVNIPEGDGFFLIDDINVDDGLDVYAVPSTLHPYGKWLKRSEARPNARRVPVGI